GGGGPAARLRRCRRPQLSGMAGGDRLPLGAGLRVHGGGAAAAALDPGRDRVGGIRSDGLPAVLAGTVLRRLSVVEDRAARPPRPAPVRGRAVAGDGSGIGPVRRGALSTTTARKRKARRVAGFLCGSYFRALK